MIFSENRIPLFGIMLQAICREMIPAGLDRTDGGGYMPANAGCRRPSGCVAQLVEQLTLNQRVHSSILCAPTKFFKDLVEKT